MSRPKNTLSPGNDVLAEELNENFDEIWEERGIERFTFGETISARDAVYLGNDGKVYKASATDTDHCRKFVGVAAEAGTVDQSKMVQLRGLMGGFSFGDLEEVVAEETFILTPSSGTGFVDAQIYQSYGASQWFRSLSSGNITTMTMELSKRNNPPNDLVWKIYAADENGEHDGDGSPLATINIPASEISASRTAITKSVNIDIEPNRLYLVWVSTTDGDSSNLYDIYVRNINEDVVSFGRVTMGTTVTYGYSLAGFEVKRTKRVNARVGDNVYLQNTAGQIGLARGDNQLCVGQILSSEKIAIGQNSQNRYIAGYRHYHTDPYGGLVVGQKYRFPVPNNTRKIIVSRDMKSSFVPRTQSDVVFYNGKTQALFGEPDGLSTTNGAVTVNWSSPSLLTMETSGSTADVGQLRAWYYT